mmetsp:Transcript_49669/g.118302  ORF Transcript_49669/g.118302 Transcript_49669/m.118302 type:complete len:216 (+) Transcript_49669:1126-1773(+)
MAPLLPEAWCVRLLPDNQLILTEEFVVVEKASPVGVEQAEDVLNTLALCKFLPWNAQLVQTALKLCHGDVATPRGIQRLEGLPGSSGSLQQSSSNHLSQKGRGWIKRHVHWVSWSRKDHRSLGARMACNSALQLRLYLRRSLVLLGGRFFHASAVLRGTRSELGCIPEWRFQPRWYFAHSVSPCALSASSLILWVSRNHTHAHRSLGAEENRGRG